MVGDSPREEIERKIAADDLAGLLDAAGCFHGHVCGYVAYGVMAGHWGVKALGVASTGMEEVLAIVETNSCFSDGVQVVTGCTFGNNGLIFRDLGKTAVTLATRDGRAMRLALRAEFHKAVFSRHPEAATLFQKLVARREEGTPEERQRMRDLSRRIAYEALRVPAGEVLSMTEMRIDVPPYAPIFSSVVCASCGESVMKPKAVMRGEEPFCRPCLQAGYFELDGAGIAPRQRGRRSLSSR